MTKNNNEAENETKDSSKENSGEKALEFHSRRHISSALTWLICGLLLIPCYIETKILAMLLLIPFLLVLAAGFYMEGKNSGVTVEGQEITLLNGTAFKKIKSEVNAKKIVSARVDSTTEKNEEIIHSVRLMTTAGPVDIPDVDDKQGLLEALRKIKPGIKIEKL